MTQRSYALGQAFKFRGKGMRFQNFNVGNSVKLDGSKYSFLPFGFSGITVSRTGDNVDASIVVPNTPLCQDFAVQALEEEWMVEAAVGSFDPEEPGKFDNILYRYEGICSSGGLDDTSITLVLNSVLDAVSGEIPHRVMTLDNVGPLPITANVGLQ